MPRGSTCKAKGCTANKNENPELSFHSFPRNKERFKLWCDLIKRPDLNHGRAITSRMSMRVCSLHFNNNMYMSPTNKSRLIWCAVPEAVEMEVPDSKEAAHVISLPPNPEVHENDYILPSSVEDITVKEESDVDQDTITNISMPSCSLLETSSPGLFADTKVGILEHSQPGLCAEDVKPNSFQDEPENCQTSCSVKSNPFGCMTQSSLESKSPESPIHLLNSVSVTQVNTTNECVAVSQESSSKQFKPSNSDSINNAVNMMEDLYQKNKASLENAPEKEKNVCNEDSGCNKCFLGKEMERKSKAIKPIPRRTYSGPIHRQVVRTRSGGKKTIMIVNKTSLKKLQAKGLIKPLKNNVAKCPNVLQSVKNIQSSSVSGDNLSKSSQTEDLLVKESDSSRKSSSILNTQPTTNKYCIRESCTDFRNELNASSHTLHTPESQVPNQDFEAPVTVSWAPVSGSNAVSFTFTVTLPTGVMTPSGANLNPLQIATSLLNNSTNCAVNLTNSQASNSLNINQKVDNQSPNNSEVSSDLKAKTTIESSAHSASSSLPSQDPFQSSTSTISSNYRPLSPVHQLFGCEIANVSKESIHKTKCTSGKLTNRDYDCCSSVNTSSANSTSTASLTHKHPNFQSSYVTIPNLASEPSNETKNSQHSKGPEEGKEKNQPSKTRPKDRDSVKWIAVPSLSTHQLRASSGTRPLQQDGLIRNCQLSNTTLHSLEQSSAVYGVFPVTSTDHQGRRMHIPPPYSSPNKELKRRYARLLSKHRHRYSLLLKKYKILEEKFSEVKDVGTPQQVIRDAQKFLSEEHLLFLESQMFLKNRPGTGNRFSRKFIKLMIEYYKRSAAGYKYLRAIFTIPSVKTIQKWLSKPFEVRNLYNGSLEGSKEDSESSSDVETYLPYKMKPNNCQDSYLYENFLQSRVPTQNQECGNNSVDEV